MTAGYCRRAPTSPDAVPRATPVGSPTCAMDASCRHTSARVTAGPDEREPERRGQPPPLGDHAAERPGR